MIAIRSNHEGVIRSGELANVRQVSATHPTLDLQTEAIRHCEIGSLMLSNGRYADALAEFEQVLDLHPHSIEGWCGRAEVLACLNRYEEALSSLEQAQELADFGDFQIRVQKAAILILLQRYADALSCCDFVLQRQPDHVQALLFQGVALHRLGQYRQAYRSYRQITALTSHQSSRQFRRSGHEWKPRQAVS